MSVAHAGAPGPYGTCVNPVGGAVPVAQYFVVAEPEMAILIPAMIVL